ncbi:MAG: acyl-CoA/acyl-ACP dehydrogenase [bacterium]|nr:acyl-CoA/acyl-ACP dehydrogenase [bacterium]
MDLTLSAEQEAVRDAIRGLLRDRLPSARVRAVMETPDGVDAEVWRTAAELGWFGLAVPEAAGGAGYGLAEAMLLFVELGRSLAPGPWLGTVVGALALASTPAAAAPLGDVLAGRTRVALVDDPGDRLGHGAGADGEVDGVFDAGAAQALLVVGQAAARFVAVGPEARVESRAGMDPTRRLGRVACRGAAALVLEGDAAHWRRVATVLAAAEATGVAERTLEASVEYAKVRQQFGQPIGAFQAIKHRCADMAVRAEVARSAVTYATVGLDEGAGDAPLHVHVAKTLAGGAALQNATDNVQNHGGMGYTWEADAHLFLKRARVLEHTMGSRTAHLDALVAPWRAAS